MYTRRSPPPPRQYRSSAGRVISRIASRRRRESSTRLRAAPFSLPPTSIRPRRHQFSFQTTCCTYVGCCTYSGSTLHAKKLFHRIRYDERCQIQSRKKDQGVFSTFGWNCVRPSVKKSLNWFRVGQLQRPLHFRYLSGLIWKRRWDLLRNFGHSAVSDGRWKPEVISSFFIYFFLTSILIPSSSFWDALRCPPLISPNIVDR